MIAGFNDLTCYEILDISPGVEAKEIQEGYYRVREIFAKNALASYSLYNAQEREEIQLIIEDAYRTLIDQKSREAYDRQLHLERVKSIKAGKALQEALPLMPRMAGERVEAGDVAGDVAGLTEPTQALERESLPAGPQPPDETEPRDEPKKEAAGAELQGPSAPPLPPRPGRITVAGDKDEDIEEAAALEREERDKILEAPAARGPAEAPKPAPPVAPPPAPDNAASTLEPPHPAPEGSAAARAANKVPGATPPPRTRDEQRAAAPAPSAPERAPARDQTPPPTPARDKTPGPAKPADQHVRPGRPWERDHKPLPGAAPVTPTGVKRSELKPPLSARGREPFEDTVYDVPSPPAKARPMDNIESGVSGKFFKERREARGMTLDQVWETTKIRRPILEAIEKEEYRKLPAAVFLKGMLKSYARVLGLEDPEAAIKGYIDRMTAAKQWIE